MRGKRKTDKRLPPRLFATDRFPCNRLNIYSKPDILPFIQHVLKNTKELQIIKDSCFGKLFELPARQCPVSCKLIHAFLTRQLVCVDSHTLWTVFRSHPIRFGLQEFGTITGLPCGEFPSHYDTEIEDQSKANRDPDWIRLIGKKNFVTIADLRHKLETDKKLTAKKKLQLALILIVDGVLIAHQQKTRPTLKYVKMVQDIDAFCRHPWGRESFLKTITCMKPPKLAKDPVGELVSLLKQDSFRLKGFPLALQLLAFQAVPQLQAIIPAPVDTLTIGQLEGPHLPVYPNISYVDILRVEADENLAVTSLIPIDEQDQPGWGVWPDVVVDDRVTYMENLIENHHRFSKEMWPGGDRSEHIQVYVPPVEQNAPKRNVLKPRKTLNKPLSTRRQRRISSYFPRTETTINQTDELLGMLSKVSTQVSKLRKEQKLMRQMIKSRKLRSHSKRSSFHSAINGHKERMTSNRGCQTDFLEDQTTDLENNITGKETPMEEDPPHYNSPIVSQYAAQQYGHQTSEEVPQQTMQPQTTSPVIDHTDPPANTPHEHRSPVHNPIEQTSPVHHYPEHNSPVHDSLDHNNTVHESPEHNHWQLILYVQQPSQIDIGGASPERTSEVTASPPDTPLWLQSTPESPPVILKSTIYDVADHPNSPPLHHLLNQGLEIFEPISPEHSSHDKPVYDTSTRRDDHPPRQPITPGSSPNKSGGFADHAVSVNAWSATATSRRISIPILNFDNSQDDNRDTEIEELSDSSPARPTPRHKPTDAECHLAAELFKSPEVPALTLLCPLPQTLWDLFEATLQANRLAFHITPSQFDFSNIFILEIAEPQKWVTTFHMEILMFMLAGRHRDLLHREKLSFTTPHLASGIQEVWKRFKPLRRKDRFRWDERLTQLVLKPGKKWMEDVYTIYTPMIWGDRHWVGLAINLDMGYIEIMDPLPDLYTDKKVAGFMEGILTSLPYLVKKVAKPQQTQFRGLKPFYWKRMKDIYINERSGDCGPVSIKFLELHAHGDPAPGMAGITDRAVDDLRKQYAMDVYKTFVLPAYHAPTFP